MTLVMSKKFELGPAKRAKQKVILAVGNVTVRTRLPRWRRSADRTCLHANSLLTGSFTGKFATSGHFETISEQEIAVPQRLFDRFPRLLVSESRISAPSYRASR
jgi:hypothetical protein